MYLKFNNLHSLDEIDYIHIISFFIIKELYTSNLPLLIITKLGILYIICVSPKYMQPMEQNNFSKCQKVMFQTYL